MAEYNDSVKQKCSVNCRRSLVGAQSLCEVLLESEKRKTSYVQLFHAKRGYANRSEPTETTRSISGSFHTAGTCSEKSSVDFSDALSTSFKSDTSICNEFIKQENNKEPIKHCLKVTNVAGSKTIGSSLWTKSSQSIASSGSGTSKVMFGKGRADRIILKVPTLGSLGPDPEASREKLEKLKRQQQYGQKVSNQNMARMMEAKVLKDFKYEMKKANFLNRASSKCS